MALQDLLDDLLDSTAIDSAGVKIGAVRQVYVDDESGRATFATVATGIFSSDAIVPLHGARLLEHELHVDHTRQEIKASPRPDHSEDGLTPDQEAELLEHYGVDVPRRGAGDAPDPGAADDTDHDHGAGGENEVEPADPTPKPSRSAAPTRPADPRRAAEDRGQPRVQD